MPPNKTPGETPMIVVTYEDLESLIKQGVREGIHDAARQAVVDTLEGLGLDVTNPLDVQKKMLFLSEMYTLSEEAKKRTALAIFGTLLLVLFGAITLGVKAWLASLSVAPIK